VEESKVELVVAAEVALLIVRTGEVVVEMLFVVLPVAVAVAVWEVLQEVVVVLEEGLVQLEQI
jgi:hypothetical protein